ncbi:hypothetical protein [Anaerobutyricum hallii]|nr:hypothetical protein [Anaerobutyricum hallii]
MKNKTEGIEYPENEILTLLQQPKNSFQREILFYICAKKQLPKRDTILYL